MPWLSYGYQGPQGLFSFLIHLVQSTHSKVSNAYICSSGMCLSAGEFWRGMCLGEAWRLSRVLQYEGTHGLTERVGGRGRKEEPMGVRKSRHLVHHPGSSAACCSSSCLLAPAHSNCLRLHHSHLFPFLGLSSSIDGPIYILLLLQVQVKARPQEACQSVSHISFFIKSNSHVHSSRLRTVRTSKTHRHGLQCQVASKCHEARLTICRIARGNRAMHISFQYLNHVEKRLAVESRPGSEVLVLLL